MMYLWREWFILVEPVGVGDRPVVALVDDVFEQADARPRVNTLCDDGRTFPLVTNNRASTYHGMVRIEIVS